jgi:hypothetical protein
LSRLYAQGLAHPLLALIVVALGIVVVVHFMTYIVVVVIALRALRARGARR